MTFNNKSLLKHLNLAFGILLILLILFGSGKNILELIYSVGTFAIITNLFLIKQPIIFFTLCYHTAQATIKVFYAEFDNQHLNDLTDYNSDLGQALRLSCIGLIALSCSIYYFLPKRIVIKHTDFNAKKLLLIYFGFIFIELLAASIGQMGGLFQIIYKLSGLKWAILFLMIYDGMTRKKNYFFLIIGFEILIGMLSYFSTFKSALFTSIISFLILNFHYLKIKRKYFLLFSALSLILIFTWQKIKEDYRIFLSGGERSQTVNVGIGDAYDKILDLVTQKSNNNAIVVIDRTIDRISYIDFFAASLNYVPREKPHTNGKLWYGSLEHIMKPRLFFPDKAAIVDSEKTMEYTGILLASEEQGSSISLGYMAESYVDFGEYFYIIPTILLGMLIGWLLKKLFESNTNSLYCWAIAVPFYFQFYGLEMASEKVLGSIVTYAIVATIIIKFGKKQMSWVEK